MASIRAATAHTAASGTLTPIRCSRPAEDENAPVKNTTSTAAVARLERAAHARAVATAKGRRVGRPSVVTESQLVHATQLRADGRTIAEITAATGRLPPRCSC